MVTLADKARRQRFVKWFEARYGKGEAARAAFMKDSGEHGMAPFSKGRVSQFFDEAQPFGERAVRQIALRIGLDPDTFLVPAPSSRGRAPPPPPTRFQDRHEVTDSDWVTLQAVKIMIGEPKLEEIRRQYNEIKEQAKAEIDATAGKQKR